MRNLSQLYTGKMTEYYIIDNNGNQVGPITEVLFYNYGVTASTLVWCEGMSEWKHASEVPGLRHLFGPAIPPTPPVTPPPFCENREQESTGYVNDQGRYQHQQWDRQYNQVCPPTYLGDFIYTALLHSIRHNLYHILFESADTVEPRRLRRGKEIVATSQTVGYNSRGGRYSYNSFKPGTFHLLELPLLNSL